MNIEIEDQLFHRLPSFLYSLGTGKQKFIAQIMVQLQVRPDRYLEPHDVDSPL